MENMILTELFNKFSNLENLYFALALFIITFVS